MAHQTQTGEAREVSTSETAPPAPSRRHVLRGVAAAGAVVVGGGLVACGSDDPDGTGQPAPDQTTGSSTAPSGTASPTDTGSPAPLARTMDIPIGGGVIFEEARVVVTQPSAGDFKAFSAICTHQGCTVAQVGDGLITCPCHGSRYRVEDGSVENGPATAPLPPEGITIDGDNIFVA